MGYIFIPIITTMILGCSSFIYGISSVPINFWNLIWHTKGRSVIDILQNPESNWRLILYNDQHHHYRWREQAHPVPRWVWRQKPCRLEFPHSIFIPKDKTVIRGYNSRLCMLSFYQIHPMSIYKTNGALSSEFQFQSIFGISSGTLRVDQLIYYKTQRAMDVWFLTMTNIITTAGENKLILYQDGYGDKTMLVKIPLFHF